MLASLVPLVLVLFLSASAVSPPGRPAGQYQPDEVAQPAAPRVIDRALVAELSAMMAGMRRESRRDALAIKDAYRPLMRTAMFDDREHLRRALDAGALVPLSHAEQFGIEPRLTGRSAIGGLDRENQDLYVTLRPAAMGMLLDIARRVHSGPLEVTSMVRSAEYQRRLLGRNVNAGTEVPTHAMGYAVDIGLLYTPMDTAEELRGVLQQMRAAGRIYFIAETNQLAFHVVPVPSRLAEFERGYTTALLAAEAHALHDGELPGTQTFEPGEIPSPGPEPGLFSRFWSRLRDLLG